MCAVKGNIVTQSLQLVLFKMFILHYVNDKIGFSFSLIEQVRKFLVWLHFVPFSLASYISEVFKLQARHRGRGVI